MPLPRYINDQGMACVQNVIDVTAAVGLVTYADPNAYHKDSDICKALGPPVPAQPSSSTDDPATASTEPSAGSSARATGELTAVPVPELSTTAVCSDAAACMPGIF